MLHPMVRLPPEPGYPSLQTGDLVEEVEALMLALARGSAPERAGQMAEEHLRTGGKRLRARLALSTASALGSSRRGAVGWAAAVELLHNATLVHDDIQDGDRVRRGRPTTWAVHGVPQAINAGDLLLMLPFLAAGQGESSADVRLQLTQLLAREASRIVRGQAADLAMLAEERLSWEEWVSVVEGKTAGLFALPVEGAALLAGLDARAAATLADAFRPLGTLFQLQDDVLDLYGEKGRGEPGSDLREGKVSALVVAHLQLRPQDRAWLIDLLRTPRDATRAEDIAEAIRRFQASGALDAALARIGAIVRGLHLSLALAAAPEVRGLAFELAAVALAPISHLGAHLITPLRESHA